MWRKERSKSSKDLEQHTNITMLNMGNMLQVVKEKVQPKSNVDQKNAMKMDVSL
jgi:hypothetical protein